MEESKTESNNDTVVSMPQFLSALQQLEEEAKVQAECGWGNEK
jgi:hypothetical protein